MGRNNTENVGVVVNTTVNSDITDTVTYTAPASYKRIIIENVSLVPIWICYGQDTQLGTRGKPLGPCQDDGAGNPVAGTGGGVVEEDFVGTIYFYSAVAANAVVVRSN